MKQKHFLVIALGALLCVPALKSNAVIKQEQQQTRTTGSFHGIKVSSGIDLHLTQGGHEAVVVKASPDLIDDIITEVKDGVLNIYMKEHHSWSWNEKRNVDVTFNMLDLLDASAGSDVDATGALNLSSIKIQTSSGSDLTLQLNAEEVRLSTSSGSDAELSGKARVFVVSASSGSDVDAASFEVKDCKASVSSGSDIDLFVTDKLEASASSGGDITYRGNPAQKDINESSGGDVTHR